MKYITLDNMGDHLPSTNFCLMQDRLGYAAVTNNPKTSGTQTVMDYFSLILHIHCRLAGRLHSLLSSLSDIGCEQKSISMCDSRVITELKRLKIKTL